MLLLPTAGIKPRLPAKQVSALSITPLPIGHGTFNLNLTRLVASSELDCRRIRFMIKKRYEGDSLPVHQDLSSEVHLVRIGQPLEC